MGKKKTRDIIIDADHLLFRVTESQAYKNGLSGKSIGAKKPDLTIYKEHFKRLVDEYVQTAEIESICYRWDIGKIRVIISDYSNFRYDIFPDYKKGRSPKSKLFMRLKKWAMKKYHFEPNAEADDVVAYYVRKGGIGFTEDKDLLYGVEGWWYNAHYMSRCWLKTTKITAERFFKKQVLAGDSGDDIPSIDGIALIKAEKLLLKYGDSWDDILGIFQDKTKVLGKVIRKESHSKKYMVTMTRLVCMSQWTPKKGIKLWKFPKK